MARRYPYQTPTTINSGDIVGVLMMAVQALEKRMGDLTRLEAENADLKARLERLEQRIGGYALAAKNE